MPRVLKKTLKGIFIAVGVVVGFFILLLVVASICAPELDEVETPPETPAPARVVELAERTEPMASATPLPVCERKAESEYMAEVRHLLLNVYFKGSNRVEEKMGDLTRNPLAMLESRWRDDVSSSLSLMTEASEDILELDAPDSLSGISRPVTRLARETIEVTSLYDSSFKDFAADRLEAGGVKFRRASDRVGVMGGYIAEINDALVRICDVEL